MELRIIQDRIYEIRGQRIMLDFDLAALYSVETRVFNQSVKRNIERFPEDFMFRLTDEEWEGMRSQIVTASGKKGQETTFNPLQTIDNEKDGMSSQIVMTSGKRAKAYLPYAFTEHGVTMLASVLKSEKAVKMSIEVVRAFIALKQLAMQQNSLAVQLQQIRDRLGEHDTQLNAIYDVMENLMDTKAEEKTNEEKWLSRERIGFKKGF